MARRSKRNDPENLRSSLIQLLTDFEFKLKEEDLRDQVCSLIPANHLLRDLGSSLVKDNDTDSARDRILSYLRKYPGTLLLGDELMVVAGISEYARRIRELRVQLGWPILSGKALKDIAKEDPTLELPLNNAKTDTYMLLEDQQDRESAFRWNTINEIRRSKLSVKEKILSYLRKNIGQKVTGEELKYLANDRSEWPRRVRELRTEEGWPIVTKVSGMPSLPVGVYVLEEDRQAEVHDRKISDPVRVAVLERDIYSCKVCGWNYTNRNIADKLRNLLELHHIEAHAAGGKNTEENLITLCNVCHDDVHRGNISDSKLRSLIQQKE